MQPPVLALTWLPRLLVRFLSRCERRTLWELLRTPKKLALLIYIYKYLIFFGSRVQALRKLTYINLMVLEVLENELLDLFSLQAQLVGYRRIKTIAITSRIEGNKKTPFL